MIGHEQIIEMRLAGKRPKHIFASFEKPLLPNFEVNPNETCNVYLENSDPKKCDLRWAYGMNIQLLSCDDIHTWVKWWIAFVDAKPKVFIGLDSDGEVNVYKR